MDKQRDFVLRTIEERGVKFVRLWFTDVIGTLKSVAIAPAELEGADWIVLPGSKAVCADLAHLRAQGWETYLQTHLRYGGKLVGICGGLQMLGRHVADPLGIEGPAGTRDGFGWLDLTTTLQAEKRLRNVRGRLALGQGADVHGY